jgi:hypothetical protein
MPFAITAACAATILENVLTLGITFKRYRTSESTRCKAAYVQCLR